MRGVSAGFLGVFLLAGCGMGKQGSVQMGSDRPSLEAARAALKDGAAGTALAIARGVLSAEPDNVAALTQAGDAQAAMEDRLSADTSYKHALRISPHDLRARLGLAKMEIRDNLHGAELSFRAILVDSPHNPTVLNDLGYVLDLQEQHKAAQDMYVEALASDPNRLSVRVNLALSLALSGEPDKAEHMLRDLAGNSGATSKVRLDLAVAQVMAGHDKDAVQTMSADLSPQDAKSALDGIQLLKPK